MKKFTSLLFIFSVNVFASYPDFSGCDNSTGMSDSYILALSSQPGFCQTYGYEAGKPECKNIAEDSYQAKHLTLHGLWPNQFACGQSYGYCGVEPKAEHCAYPALNLSTKVAKTLDVLMPSYKYGSCLERHEWNKHGSCQVLSEDNYFSLAMRLTSELDNSIFGRYLTSHYGEKVRLSELRAMVVQVFGKTNSSKVYLGCRNGILVDIFIKLPALLPFDDSLESLVSKAQDPKAHDACPSHVMISNFNKNSWL